MIIPTRSTTRVFSLFVVLCAGWLGLINGFDQPHVNMWDEATYALNAYDQAVYGLSLDITSEGQPDYYNTKPPLSIWIEALFIRVFGFNTFGIRFHAILFALLTALVVWYTTLRITGRTLVATLAGTTLLLFPGFIHTHVTRTADLDSVLIFFETIYVASTVCYAYKKIPPSLFTVCLAGGLFLAFMSKGIAGYMMVPSCLVFLTIIRPGTIRQIPVWGALCIALVLSGLYYGIKGLRDPKYLEVVYRTEISRYWDDQVISWISKPFTFYLDWMANEGGGWMIFFLVLAIIPLVMMKKVRIQLTALLLIPFLYMVVISIPAAKMHWYDGPCYPWFAVGIAVTIYNLYEVMGRLPAKAVLVFRAILIVLVCTGLYGSYRDVLVNNAMQLSTITALENEGHALKSLCANDRLPGKLSVYKSSPHPEYNDQVKASALMAHAQCGAELSLIESHIPTEQDLPLLIAKRSIADSLISAFSGIQVSEVGDCLLLSKP